MFFGNINIDKAKGAILAHSQKFSSLLIRKGTTLTNIHIKKLKDLGIEKLVCARLEKDDVDENSSATELASKFKDPSLKFSIASTGRINFFSKNFGILRYDKDIIINYNLVDEGVTLALLPNNSLVKESQLVGTLKIIPYSIPHKVIKYINEQVCRNLTLIKVRPIIKRKVALIQTSFPETKENVILSSKKTTEKRLGHLNCLLDLSLICSHNEIEIKKNIDIAIKKRAGIILISCASAVSDRKDVLPKAIEDSGGNILHFGLPVDPGNLLLLGDIDSIPIIGLPGCARSISFNGFDLILRMLLSGVKINKKDIAELSIGGLLKEIKSRPLPRKRISEII